MALALLLAALLSFPAHADPDPGGPGAFQSACFHGQNDADTPATLAPCDSPAMLNVESNLTGTAILKRRGFNEDANLSCATCPVTGSHSFIDSSGNRLDIICQNRYCAKKTNGNAPVDFLTTAASSATRWSFVDAGGILYGGNNAYDPIIKYDGTSLSRPSGMPKGSILELTQDRLVVGDIQSLPNRVHKSSAGYFEGFTTGSEPEDSYFDDIGAPGDRIRGIKCIEGFCYYFKTGSITGCEEGDQYTTRCAVVSPNIGTTDPAAIVTAGSALYFRAQDKNYWELSSSGLREISRKIPALVKSQSGGLGGGENTNTQTTQADWQAGTQVPLATFDTASLPGSIFPSSATLLDTSDADFSSGTFYNTSTGTAAGYLVSAPSATAVIVDNFSDEQLTSNPAWTLDDADWQAGRISAASFPNANSVTVACRAQPDASYDPPTFSNGMRTQAGIPYGTWNVSIFNGIAGGGSTGLFLYQFIYDTDGSGYLLQATRTGTQGVFTLGLYRTNGVSSTQLGSDATVTLDYGTVGAFSVSRSTAGVFDVRYAGSSVIVSTDTTYDPSSPQIMISIGGINQGCSAPIVAVATISASVYASTGHFVSRVFDTGYSTATGGTFTVSSSVPAGTSLSFGVRSAATQGGLTGAFTAISNGDRATQINRYWQYASSFTTTVGTQTAAIADVSIVVATTGTFRTQCIQPNSSISAWGSLSCAEQTAGNGSLVYYATSAVSCATLPAQNPHTWQTSVSNNATLSIATNTAVVIGWRSLLGSATDQAQVDACVLAWNEGTPTQPSWAVYDSVKNAVYWTATVNNAASTNRLLKYDRNLEAWYPFDIPAQAPKMVGNSLYFGGASSGTWNLYGLVDSDNGAAINAYWTSKDVGSDKPFQEKSFQTASVLSRNNQAGSMTATYTFSNAETGSYSISLSTGAGINYARSNFNLPQTSPNNFMNLRLGNNNTTPFEILGIGITWNVWPWGITGP